MMRSLSSGRLRNGANNVSEAKEKGENEMASTPRHKRTPSRPEPGARRVVDLTTDELRALIEQLIEHKLAEFSSMPTRSTENLISPQMRQRAASAAGRFHSGLSDIS